VEVADDGVERHLEHLAEMDELARAEAVNVDLRELRLHVGEQVEIPLEREFRMMPALEQDLRAAQFDRLRDLPVHLLMADDVGVGIPLHAIERAELAVDVADVGVVDIAIDVAIMG